MHWSEYFQEHIQHRGFDYYKRGLVDIEKQTKHFIEAKVHGSEVYHVEIELMGQDAKSVFCDCPHAAEGNYCKHAAAVLYAFEVERVKTTENERYEENIDELVHEADEATIRRFLIQVLEENVQLLNRFKGAVGQKLTQKEFSTLKREISELFYAYSDSSGFINYYEAIDLDEDLSVFIQNTVEANLMRNRHYKEAFELTKIICQEISQASIDDSGGIIVNIVGNCVDIWQEIIAESEIELKREMFQWFKEQINGSLHEYIEEQMIETLFNHFTEQEFLKEKSSFSKERFDEYRNQQSEWIRDYQAQYWAIKHLEVLEFLQDNKKVEDFSKNHLEFPRVREFYVDYLLGRGQVEDALQLLEEGGAFDKEKTSSKISRAYHIKLKDLYLKVGNQEAYQKKLWQLIKDRGTIDKTSYEEYKAVFSKEEWAERRHSVIQELSNLYGLDKILYREKLYEDLLSYVVKMPNLSTLQTYEQLLVKLYPEEVFNRYEKEILNLSEVSGDRKKYRKIVSIIRRLKELPGSKEKVQKIVTYLKESYSNRPAKMDELSRIE